MPKTEGDPLDRAFEWRLRAELDRVEPPYSPPRYQKALPFRASRLAPALIACATTILAALTATAATGSADPVVWTQRAATTIESVRHVPDASPTPEASPSQAQKTPPKSVTPVNPPVRSTARPTSAPEGSGQHEGGHSPYPRQSPWPSDSPEASDRPGQASPSPSSHPGGD